MTSSTEIFNLEYYSTHCGDLPYLRSTPEWHDFFKPIADAIALGLRPGKVFDAGCAVGFLVEALWDRGIETHGRDVSEFAISEVRADIREWCEVGSIADPIEGSYDLVLCIEVLEHMTATEALSAIRNITTIAPRVLFSSSPTDLEEVTHINVRPTRYWLERFAEMGFAPVVDFDATFLTPHAVLFERSEDGRSANDIAAFAEIVRQRLKVAAAVQAMAKAKADLNGQIAEREQKLHAQHAAIEADLNGQIAERDRQLSAQHAALQEARTACEEEATSNRDRLSTSDRDLIKVKADAAALRSMLSTLEKDNQGLQGSLDLFNKDIQILRNQSIALEKHNEELNINLTAVENDKEKLTHDIQVFGTENDALRDLAERLTEENGAIRKQLDGVNEERDQLQSKFDMLIKDLDKLKKDNDDLRGGIDLYGQENFKLGQVADHSRKAVLGHQVSLVTINDLRAELDHIGTGAALLRVMLHARIVEAERPSATAQAQSRRKRIRKLIARPFTPMDDQPMSTVDPRVVEVQATGLFDSEYYLTTYPDVAESGVDPVHHYATIGWTENRQPNPNFDPDYYTDQNPDVLASGINPLLHFAEFGAVEGRSPSAHVTLTTQAAILAPDERDTAILTSQIRETGLFDSEYYLSVYPDLKGFDPVEHYAISGWKEGRWPNPEFDPIFYLAQNSDVAESGINPLVHYASMGIVEGRAPLSPLHHQIPSYTTRTAVASQTPSARSLIRDYQASFAPFPSYRDKFASRTLTIVTNSIDSASLFGGVGTAIVIGALIAQRQGMRLRLATRNNVADPAALGHVLHAHCIDWTGPTEFAHVPLGSDRPLALGDDDLILTTSWWTTRSVLGSMAASRVLYLLQEDERMFYPYGDERLRCAETLARTDVNVLINTRLLFDHLADGEEALPDLRTRGAWFNPAFPAINAADRPEPGERKKFFFYARPDHQRNLYWRGLEAIEAALREGVFRDTEWDFYFVGGKVPAFELPGGIKPKNITSLPWMDYAKLVISMDLGLCLMGTPHPSYPPLDLAAGGAVVVTNTCGPKQSLDVWSRNIIAVPPTVAELVAGLKRGRDLVDNPTARAANFGNQNIPTDWKKQLEPAFNQLHI